MGTHTNGSLSVGFSRELTEAEFTEWDAKVKAGRPVESFDWHCGNSKHEGQLRDPATGRCPLYDETPEAAGYCFAPFAMSYDRYDPERWVFDDSGWGDVGIARLNAAGFEIESDGKVYDIVDMVRFSVECLPADIQAGGSGDFESDSEPWGLRVRGRKVEEFQTITVDMEWLEQLRELSLYGNSAADIAEVVYKLLVDTYGEVMMSDEYDTVEDAHILSHLTQRHGWDPDTAGHAGGIDEWQKAHVEEHENNEVKFPHGHKAGVKA